MIDIQIDYAQLQGHVLEITRQLNKDNWKPDYVVGITPGGLLPALLISQYLEIPLYTLKVTFVDGIEDDCDHNAWMADDAFENKKNILIFNDVNDQGSTISWIRQDWMSGCFPTDSKWKNVWGNNVRTAVIVNNIVSEQEVDYCSLEINKLDDPCYVVFPIERWWNK